jgi:serine/threonine protein phosphatase PrpC
VLHFSYGAASHAGLVRAHNEDAGFAGAYLQLGADGVGGAAAGDAVPRVGNSASPGGVTVTW